MHRNLLFFAFASCIILSLYACGHQGKINCLGLEVPRFKNPKVDALVQLKDSITCLAFEYQQKGTEIPYELTYEISAGGARHMEIFELLDKDGDQAEIDKYGEFNQALGKKAMELRQQQNQ